MRVHIYLDPVSANAPAGGAAYTASLLAEHLEPNHDVELLHHRASFTRELLNHAFGTHLERTTLRYCEPVQPILSSASRIPWRRYRTARRWRMELSANCDAFVAFVTKPPPFCHAGKGILVVLFPFFDPERDRQRRPGFKASLLRMYDAFEWQRRFASYRHRFAISEFARAWTRRRWKIECGILYPPVELVGTAAKENLILSVGRFTPLKRQPEMVAAFRALSPLLPAGWTFACAGGLDSSAESAAYFARAEEASAGACVRFCCNLGRRELNALYGQAKIFWHAMGYLADITDHPERLEHFGIVTVEAMSAGCVPVVFDGGGQVELVRHGVDGFRWKTLGELYEYTRRLAEDDDLRDSMSQSAAKRALEYSGSSYLASMTKLIDPR